jgi:hypothetical protein
MAAGEVTVEFLSACCRLVDLFADSGEADH